jgi:hypothetical protein
MTDPKWTRWGMALGAAAAVAVVVTFAAIIRPGAPPEPVIEAELKSDTPPPEPSPTPLPPPLNRGDLVALAGRAAAAFAAGGPYPADNKALNGRRFEISIAFGCSGPNGAASVEPARWSVDPVKKTITLASQSSIWTETPWVRDITGATEAEPPSLIEGFWIPRPWMAAEGCPPFRMPGPAADAPAASAPSLGLVRTISATASRLTQGGNRPYETVIKATDQQLSSSLRAYSLVLRGRIAPLEEGEPVRCQAPNIDTRPVCLIGVEIDQAAFVDPATGESLAQWER